MKDWEACPDCWGTGLVAGWVRLCERSPDLDDLQPFLRAVSRAIVRKVVQRAIEKMISEHQLKLR